MDDPRILRVITVGLVLAVLAVVYFLFTGGFSVSKSKVTQVNIAVQSPAPTVVNPSVQPSVLGQQATQPSPTPTSAYNAITKRNQQATKALPSTGFPIELAVVFSFSALVIGLSLRKFPK